MGTLAITHTLENLSGGEISISVLQRNFEDVVNFINNGNLNVSNVPDLANKEGAWGVPSVDDSCIVSTTGGVRSWQAKENPLGNPSMDGLYLFSDKDGTRYWDELPEIIPELSNIQVFMSGGTWVNPGDVNTVLIEMWGAGGGGQAGRTGNATLSDVAGDGGGAGAYIKIVRTNINGNINVIIGAGGAGGASARANGAWGGDTEVLMNTDEGEVTAKAKGGQSGTGGAGGGLEGTYNLGITGGSGAFATFFARTFPLADWNVPGGGGSSPKGGQGGRRSATTNGRSGLRPGGGGAGGVSGSEAGGAGASGLVIIRW